MARLLDVDVKGKDGQVRWEGRDGKRRMQRRPNRKRLEEQEEKMGLDKERKKTRVANKEREPKSREFLVVVIVVFAWVREGRGARENRIFCS